MTVSSSIVGANSQEDSSRVPSVHIECTSIFVNAQSDISTLENLTVLDLGRTKVDGDVKGLSTLVNLTELHLRETKVDGAVKGLSTPGFLLRLSVTRPRDLLLDAGKSRPGPRLDSPTPVAPVAPG